ncbi:MAG: response regulator [Candidatus Aminicenantes bacterium]|nr:response regulator [Candidatus Aminicenantes bacterium]
MAKIKILVVEDESLVAKDIHNMLRGQGYDVVGVLSTGEEALQAVRTSPPDLVLMDIVLKGEIDGIAAAETIWEEYGIPVIYLTAYADETTLARAKITEPFGYILKPFDERELQTTIEMAFFKAKMDKTLREREEWLSTVLRSIGDGVIAADAEGLVTFLNPLAERLTGLERHEILGRPLSEILPVRLDAADFDPEGRALRTEEGVLTDKAGRSLPIEQTVSPIRGRRPTAAGHVLIFRDITARKKAETEIRQSTERLKKALAGTIQAMAMTIEMRDPYTAGHQRRVSKLSCAIAARMGLPPEQIEGIRMAGEIHDVGKIYVPAEILSKPGQLTEIEFSIIRTHAQVGYDILKTIEFPWPIAKIVHQHHERMDGSGYPSGLRGEAILLEARIVCVADIVEAMSSHRPYRPARGVEAALEEVSRGRGRQYDPDVVDACLALFRQDGFRFE